MEGQPSVENPTRQLRSDEKEFINTQYLCTLCKTPLELHFEVDNGAGKILEEASCPKCQIRTRSKNFSLQ